MLGLIGIAVGLASLVYKGYSLVIAAPVATMIVVLFNGLPLIGSMFGPGKSCMSGLASFILSNFPVFLFGAILAKSMDKSGAALSIAEKLMKLVGTLAVLLKDLSRAKELRPSRPYQSSTKVIETSTNLNGEAPCPGSNSFPASPRPATPLRP